MAAYEGKYPNRIASVWGTYYRGVCGCRTNGGASFYYCTKDVIAKGFKVSHSQILKLDITDSQIASVMHATIEAAIAANNAK
jgi:hypothetical protein